MNSRIFKVYFPYKKKDIDEFKLELKHLLEKDIRDDIEELKSVNGMDYYKKRTHDLLLEDIVWLLESDVSGNTYEVNPKSIKHIDLDGNKIYCIQGKMYDSFKKIVRRGIKSRQELIRTISSKSRLSVEDFYMISQIAYPTIGFLFYTEDYELVNMVKLYDYVSKSDRMYVLEGYSYHF